MLKNSYNSLNNTFKRQLVFRVGISSGFFSEYNNMIWAMLYCLDHKIKFKLSSSEANFDVINGWNGFFEPFCDEENEHINKHWKSVRWKNINWRYAVKLLFKGNINEIKNICPYLTLWKQRLLTQDVFAKSRDVNPEKIYNFPLLEINGDMQQVCTKLITLTWRYNPQTKKEVDHYKSMIPLTSGDYIGLHIREGDKSAETKLLSPDIYINKASLLSSLKKAFVLTDNYNIIEYLQSNYPDWDFYTLCTPSERGYYHHLFLQESYDTKRDRLVKLFASMDILASASLFIGTYSSNPGIYLGMRMPKEKVCGVDFDKWLIW